MRDTKRRIMEAMHSLRREGKSVSIMAVSRRAGVNRTGLYKSHREIVELIQASTRKKTKLEVQEKLAAKLHRQLQLVSEQKETIALLTRLCIELNASLHQSIKRAKRKQKTATSRIAALSKENSEFTRRAGVTKIRFVKPKELT